MRQGQTCDDLAATILCRSDIPEVESAWLKSISVAKAAVKTIVEVEAILKGLNGAGNDPGHGKLRRPCCRSPAITDRYSTRQNA